MLRLLQSHAQLFLLSETFFAHTRTHPVIARGAWSLQADCSIPTYARWDACLCPDHREGASSARFGKGQDAEQEAELPACGHRGAYVCKELVPPPRHPPVHLRS